MRDALALSSLFGVALLAGAAFVAAPALGQNPAPPAYVTAAIEDPDRPETDKARDAKREPAAMLEFAEIRPGSLVAEWIPGGGYFTRIFAKAVGPSGHVYALVSPGRNTDRVQAIADQPAYAGAITVVSGDLATAKTPRPVDVVWTSQNYHDMSVETRAAVNKASFDMLKPGGIYIILDHAAQVGSGPTSRLHRVDEAQVKTDALAAGFEYVGESNALRNPNDNRDLMVSDSSLDRDTDQFILKFRKPG